MADFPRDVPPISATPFAFPQPGVSVGLSGATQIRGATQIGRSWTETYPTLQLEDDIARGWLAEINSIWGQGTLFDIVYQPTKLALGSAGGTPLVDGASQSGLVLNMRGGTTTTTDYLRKGDLLKIAGIIPVYDVQADVDTDGAGDASISIYPAIVLSPADGAALNFSDQNIRARISNRPTYPSSIEDKSGVQTLVSGITIQFVEVPN